MLLLSTYTGALEGKSGRGAEKLPQPDLSAYHGGGETEHLQQGKLRKIEGEEKQGRVSR